MYTPGQVIPVLSLWQRIIIRGMDELDMNYSPRQMAVLLSVYITPPPHTVKNLSEQLNISKPAICRALDTLADQKLLKRKPDPYDKRNVLIQRTVKGSVYLSELADIIQKEMQPSQQPLTEMV